MGVLKKNVQKPSLVFQICLLVAFLIQSSARPDATGQPVWLIVIKLLLAIAIGIGIYALDIRITPKVTAERNVKKKLLLAAEFIIPYIIAVILYVLFCYYVI